jgi:hypothetical protein
MLIWRDNQLWVKRDNGVQNKGDPSVWAIRKVLHPAVEDTNHAVVLWEAGLNTFPYNDIVPVEDLCRKACEFVLCVLAKFYNLRPHHTSSSI